MISCSTSAAYAARATATGPPHWLHSPRTPPRLHGCGPAALDLVGSRFCHVCPQIRATHSAGPSSVAERCVMIAAERVEGARMSNFAFLRAEWPELFAEAARAER